jgi:hypothetical protein
LPVHEWANSWATTFTIVLHAAVRKRRRHDEHVEALPVVGTEQRLGGGNVVLDVGELPGGGVEDAGLGPHATAWREVSGRDVPDGEGQQIGRDGLGHRPAEGVILVPGRGGGHDDGEAGGDGERGGPGDPQRRRVLAGHDASGVDGLTLAEQEGLLFAEGLGGLQPLQRRRRVARAIADVDRPRSGLELHLEARAEHGDGRMDHERESVAVAVAHGLDVEVAGVEVEGAIAGRRRGKHEGDAADEPAGGEVDHDVPVERSGAGLLVISKRVGVEARHVPLMARTTVAGQRCGVSPPTTLSRRWCSTTAS